MREKDPIKLKLNILLDEAYEDYVIQKNGPKPEDGFVIFYQIKNGQKHFIDYEQVYEDPHEYAKFIDDLAERERFLKKYDEQEPKPLIVNALHAPEEKMYFVDIETIIWILTCMLNKGDIIELKVVKYYMTLRNMTGAELARKIGTTKQFIHGLLKAQYPIPRNKYEIIATALGFEMVEYFKKEEPFVFDETDL